MSLNKFREQAMRAIFILAACVSILCVIIITAFLIVNGLPAIFKIGPLNFLTKTSWKPDQNLYGILPMILGSVYATALSVSLGSVIGIFTAVFLVFYCPKNIYKFLKPLINLLAGIPSIIYGFFGMVIIIPFVHNVFGGNGKAILTAGLLLGFMILPTIITVSESSIRAVPIHHYEGALALGASKERAIFGSTLKGAKSGISAGIILGIGRSIGETMAVIMIAGNQAVIPTSILKGFRTLTANIVLEMGYAADLHREALISTALVLFVFILIINALFSIITNKDKK